jgi:hypothetical protein
MTGLMPLDSRDMARTAFLAVAEEAHRYLTNKEKALEWMNKAYPDATAELGAWGRT